ncbi:MAG: M42 family metallopeptidase [Candidatus Njordarchaeia archaeon]
MDNINTYLSILEKLSNAFGPPGDEKEIKEIIRKEVQGFVDEIFEDKMGNLYLIKKGSEKSPKVLISAHMDEVSLIITHIHKNGFIRFAPLGGFDPRVLYAQKLIIKGEKGYIEGYIGAIPPHLMKKDASQGNIDVSDLFIDIGANSKEEVEEMGIRIGSRAVFNTKFSKFGKKIAGKAFDDRVGIATMIEVFKRLSGENYNIIGLATVQEEVGLRGARASVWNLEPDFALILECTAAGDIPGTPEHKQSTRQGEGPALTIVDASMLAHPSVLNRLIDVARKKNIRYQFKQMPVGGTDAGAIHLAKGGIPSGVISVPGRYIHSPLSIVDINDVKGQIELVVEFIKSVNNEYGV